jgi:hypothetical protein
LAERTQSAPGDRQGAEGEGWRRHEAKGDMIIVIIVRYADDFIVGFEYETRRHAAITTLSGRKAQAG